MKHKGLIIAGSIIVAILVVCAFTVLNKKWWARRITAKWDIVGNLAENDELLRNTTLRALITMYYKGQGDLQLRGAAQTTAEVETDVPNNDQ